MNLIFMRNLILIIGWPILIGGSIFIFIKGRQVYQMVKGSLVGRITKTLVYSMLVGMYCLGIVCTVFMYNFEESVYLVLPIFLIWFVSFVLALRVLIKAEKEVRNLSK